MAGRVTMADVATRAGVSTATVSLVLGGRGEHISAATAARVRRAADDLGYVPNASARTLRTRRTQTIGFVSDEVTVTRFASAMVRGILDEARERSHAVMMMETGRDQQRIREAFTTLASRQVDGIIVGLMDSAHVELPDSPAPLVVVNGTATGRPAILPDESSAGRAAVEHLVRHGHRRIAVIGMHPQRPEPRVSVNIGVRMDGITAAMADAGLRFADAIEGTVWEPELGHRGTHEVLSRTPDVTAVLALNDRIAFGVQQALGERGLRMGQQVSVMSFDDEPLAALMRPGLTTMRLPYREMGAAAVRALLDAEPLVAAGPAGQGATLLPMPLVARASTNRP